MMTADLINALFETLAGFFILLSIRQLYKDKRVRGLSVIHVTFFWLWGVWNVFYYPHLGQPASLVGAVLVLLTNTIWTAMLIYYKRKPCLEP
jgi:hypothetical protein